MEQSKELLTVAEAAERLGVTAKTVRKLCNLGHIPGPFKIPGVRGARIQARHIGRYLDDMERGTLKPVPPGEEGTDDEEDAD